MRRKGKEDPWELIETDFDRIWTLCAWLKDQTTVKKISPDEFRAALTLMINVLKQHLESSDLKGEYRRTIHMHDVLRDNEVFADIMLHILHPDKDEDLFKWFKGEF